MLGKLAGGAAIIAGLVQAAVPAAQAQTGNLPTYPSPMPPSLGTMPGFDSGGHAIVNGRKLQPEIENKPTRTAIRETLDGIDRLLKSDEAEAGRGSTVIEPYDLYGHEIGGNPGLQPLVDPSLK